MQTVLIVLHLMIVLALVVVVLLQRSEGGALGVGGGSNFMSGRGQANALTRVTAYLAAGFFVTSLTLTILAGYGGGSVLDRLQPTAATIKPAAAPAGAAGPQVPLGSGQGGILPELRRATEQPGAAQPPQPAAPAAPQQPTAPITPQEADPKVTGPTDEPKHAPAQETSPQGSNADDPKPQGAPPAAMEQPAQPQAPAATEPPKP